VIVAALVDCWPTTIGQYVGVGGSQLPPGSGIPDAEATPVVVATAVNEVNDTTTARAVRMRTALGARNVRRGIRPPSNAGLC
jgi:hypothetical protein